MARTSKRIPSLDGLRAVSIILVILLHTLQRINVARPVGKYWYVLGNGATGVYIFFVISGFLITNLLLSEQERSGTINLRRFYIGRVFRILPPAYCYVAVVAIVACFGKVEVTKANILSVLFFAGNYTRLSWPLNHFWTLSIEEQFYLIWPGVLLMVLKHRGRVAAARVGIAVIVVCPLVRIATHFWGGPYLRYINGISFQGRADALMFGCVAALLSGNVSFERLYLGASRYWWWFVVILMVFSGGLEAWLGTYWDYPVGYTLNGVCISVVLLWCVRNPESVVGRCLNHKSVVLVGILSYSIYIWQQLFLNPNNGTVFGSSVVGSLPVSYISILLAASLSYFVVERPSLRLRDMVLAKPQQKPSNLHAPLS
jgi:peptidoglycan/LPS O-acetylase OafA/YrhL